MTPIIRHALLLAAKDMRIFWRNPLALVFAVLTPLGFAFAFTYAGNEDGPRDVAPLLTVVAHEEESILREILAGLAGAEWTVDERTQEQARNALTKGEIGGFLLFPEGSWARMAAGGEARIHVVVSGNDPAEQAKLEGIARAVAGRLETLVLAARAVVGLAAARAPNAERLVAVSRLPPLVSLEMKQTGSRERNPINYTLPGYLTMFVFLVAALGAGSIVRERQTRTLERLMSNGVRPPSILAGKFLAAAGGGFAQLAVLWTVGVLGLSLDLGASPGAVVAVSLLFALASAAFGVMLAAVVNTMRSAASIAVLASLTLAPLGGCWWPLFIAPDWLRALAHFTPHGWANDAFNRLMLFGARASDVVPDMLALAAFTVVFGAIALVRFRVSPPA